MIRSDNKNLLKIFVLCIFSHILMLPVFSLVLPAKITKPRYHLVYLYQEAKSQMPATNVTKITPQLPATRTIKEQKIEIYVRETGRLERDISIGVQKTPLLTVEKNENISWELPVTKIIIPGLQPIINISESESKMEGTISEDTFEISGPGGTRPIISKVLPEYPVWAEQQSIESNVSIKIWVNKNGFVSSTDVIETSGYRKLDLLAEEALKKWRFAKIEKDVDVWAIVTFKFRLK